MSWELFDGLGVLLMSRKLWLCCLSLWLVGAVAWAQSSLQPLEWRRHWSLARELEEREVKRAFAMGTRELFQMCQLVTHPLLQIRDQPCKLPPKPASLAQGGKPDCGFDAWFWEPCSLSQQLDSTLRKQPQLAPPPKPRASRRCGRDSRNPWQQAGGFLSATTRPTPS